MKRKNRFISIILVAMMLLSVVSSGFTAFAADEEGENPTPPAADNARDVSQLGEVPIYWARSQEWNYPELDQDINVNTLTLHNTNISSYKLSDLLGGRTDGKDAAGAPFTDGVDYNYSALDIAYADSVLSSKNALKNALAGVKDPDGAAEKVWALYSGEQKRPTVKSGIQYVWDGGYNTEGIAALNDLFFTDYAAEGGAVTYIYDYKHTFYHRVTDMFYVGEYSSEGVYAPGSVVKCADGEYYRYIGKGTASNPPVLGSPSNQADLFNGWERLDSLTEAPENFEENYNKDAYNRELGIYYPFTNTQEATDGVTFSRIGNPEKQGEWCTWVSHVAATNGQDSMNTTVRRFSGYFYLEDNIDVNDAYLALSDGTPLMAADDMFYLFINGYPIYAVSTKPTGEGTGKGNMPNILGYEKDDNNNILKDNIAIDPNAVMTLGKNGYDITGGVYQANESCNLPDTADCIVSPVGKEYDASGKFTGWSLRNKVKNPETGKYEYEIDPKTGKYVYYKSGDSVADGSTFAQIEKFGTYQESMLNNHDYAFAAYWHIHTNQTKLDISDYLKPGEANRIDIIAGDFNNGGGMTRPHLFTAGKYIESAEIGVNVEAYIDQKHKDTNTKFDHKISPEFAEGGSGIVKDAEPQPTGTPVYYEYTITNPDNQGSTDLKDVVLTDHNLNLEFSKDGIRKFTVNEDGTKTYGDPLPEDGLEFTVTKKDGTTTTGTTLEALKDAMGNNPGKTFEVGTTIVIRYPGTEIAYDAVGQHPTTVTVDGTSVKDTVGKVSASDSTYVIMEKATTDDWVVVDFGLPVELNVMQNDEFSWERDADNKPIIENGKEKVIGHVDNVAKGDFAEKPEDGVFAAQNVRGNYGYMSVSRRDDYSVRYVPTQFMDGTDLFTYQSTYGENDQTGYATVQVIPATNVYYEDNFNANDALSGYDGEDAAIIYDGNWSTVGNDGNETNAYSSTSTNKNQSSDNSTDGTDNDNYGYDSIYDSDKFFSFDSAHEIGGAEDSSVETQAQYQEKLKANGGTITEGGKTYTDTYLDYLRYKNRHLGEDFNGEDATVEFKFRGTGFDIISTSTNDAGVMNCYVYPITVDADGNETVSGTPVKSIKVSNYYEVKNNDLYQIPVIAVKNLPYGKYKVKLVIEGLRAYPSKGNVIVLDGIRVYNPLGEEGDEHYTATEKNAVIYEVRDLLIGRTLGTEEKYNNDDIGANRIALFGTQNFYVGSNDDASDDASHPESGLISGGVALDRYNMDGPQNELYLTSVTTGVTFKYAPTEEHVEHSIPLTLQVEAKSPNGGSGMTVNCYFNTPSPEDGAKPATIGENNISCFKKTRTETVATGTQMYYDFTDLLPKIPQECIIEIVKTGESTATITKGTNILSLSTIKVTEGAALSREVTNFNPVTPVMVGVGFAPAETSVYVGGMPQTVTLNKLYQIGTSEPLVVNASSVTFEPNASVSAAYDPVTGNVTVTPSVGAEPGTTKLVVNYTNEEKETFTAELNIKLEAPQEDVIEKVFFLGHEDATEIYLPIGAESTLIPVIKLKGSGELVWQESTGITLTETGFAPAEIVNDEATGRRSYVLKNAAAGDVKNVTLAASMLGGNKHNAAVAIRFIDTSVLNFNPIDVSYLPESTVVLKNGANKIDVSDAEVEYKEDEHGFTKVQSLLKAYKDKDVTLSITESDFSVEIDANDNLIVTVPKDSTKTKVKANVNVLVDGEVIGFFPVSFDYVAATSLTLDPPAANINYLMRGQSLTFTANVMPVSATNAVAWKIPATTPAGITITEDGNKLTVSVSDSFVLPEGENAVIYNGEIAASVQGVWGEQLAKVNIYDVNKAGEFSITETHPNYVANDIVISGDKYYVALGWVNTAPTPEDKLNWVYLGDVVTEPQVTISPASKTIFIGDSFGFTASTVNFEDASTELTWSSDNTTVATVAQDGTVTAVSEGTANIKVTSQAYPELYAEAVVKVVERPVVKSITITNTETELPKNKTLPLNVEVRDQKGELVDGAALAWHISPAIATIDASNVLIPSAEGDVTIFATYDVDGVEQARSDPYTIKITSAYNFTKAKIIPVVTDVETGKTKYEYGAWFVLPNGGAGASPTAILNNTNLEKTYQVTENSSDYYFGFANTSGWQTVDGLKSVKITISEKGVDCQDITISNDVATPAGTEYGELKLTELNNETGVYTYELRWTENAVPTVEVDSVTIAGANKTNTVLNGAQTQLTATVLPADAAAVRWSSNATSIATVDNTGKVTAVGAGTATITASAGGKSDSVTFTVLDPVTNVVVTGTSNGYVGESVELTAILVGSEYESISWACDAGAPVITQDSTDPTKVTLTFAEPVANATVTVTVNNTDEAIANGAATSVTDNTFSLVITQKPAEVKVNEITITGETQPVTGRDFTLTANLSPTGAVYKSIKWTVNNGATTAIKGVDNGESVTLTAGDVGEEATVTVTVTNNDDSIETQTHIITVQEAGAVTGPVNVKITDATTQRPYGVWFASGQSYPATTPVNEHKDNTKALEIGNTYYYSMSVYNSMTYIASYAYALKIEVASNGTVKASVGNITSNPDAGNQNYTLSYSDATTEFAVEVTQDGNNATLNFIPALPANEAIAPAKATLVGNGPAILGVAEDGEMTDIDTAAAYTMLTDSGVTPNVVASLGYSLVAKEGYTLLEDAVKSLVFEDDASDVIVVSINDAMTAKDSVKALIPAMESLLNTLHTLSPNAKIVLVGSRGAYTRFMEDAVKATGLGEIVFFMEDTSSAVVGEQAVIEQEELTNQIAAEVARILSLDEASDVPADAWTAITVYDAGDIVLYNGKKYECVTAHVAKNNSYNPEELPDYWKVIS